MPEQGGAGAATALAPAPASTAPATPLAPANPHTATPTTTSLTVLYDATCPLCTRFRGWLQAQELLVPITFVPAGSPEAVARFPGLDPRQTLREITVVGDSGAVWTMEYAWVMCLWATRRHRVLAERLAQPQWLPVARGAAYSAAGLRAWLRRDEYPGGGGYPDGCAGSCDPRGLS